tara:strand:+ start:325 stop:1059 length:735 start_codon:yes stop_codon:yes gene_type:complete
MLRAVEMSTRKLIAVVEDEISLRENYLAALTKQGYQVAGYSTRQKALSAFKNRLPDLVIIDISLGNEVDGGFELCKELRAQSSRLPIIFLTAKDSDYDVVSGLRLGADDYLIKPISIEHLLARVTALLRRIDVLSATESEAQIIERGSLKLDLDRITVSWKDRVIDLTVTEFWVVHSLAQKPGHVRNRDQLMSAARVHLDDGSVTSQIKRIRSKFTSIDAEFSSIETVYGMGYRWINDQPMTQN